MDDTLPIETCEIDAHHVDGVFVVCLAGEVDVVCWPDLNDLARRFSTPERVPGIVIDFTETTWIDVRCAHLVDAMLEVAETAGRTHVVTGLNDRLRRLLRIMRTRVLDHELDFPLPH